MGNARDELIKPGAIEIKISQDYAVIFQTTLPITGPKHFIKSIEGFLSALRYDMPNDIKEEVED